MSLHAISFLDALVQGIAVVSAVADHAFRGFGKESLVKCGFDELSFMRRSAGHVHGERKTMAVCDCHDFAAFAAFCRADTRGQFFPQARQQPTALPVLEASMTGLIGRIARRQIVPRSPRAQHPKDSVQYRTRVLPRSPSPIGSSFGTKQR